MRGSQSVGELRIRYATRADLDHHIEQLNKDLGSVTLDTHDIELLDRAANAQELLPQLEALCDSEDFPSYHELQLQLNSLHAQKAKCSLRERIPIVKKINEVQELCRRELDSQKKYLRPKEYEQSRQTLIEAYKSSVPDNVQEVAPSFLVASTENFSEDREVGRGGFASVYVGRVKDKDDDLVFAIKKHFAHVVMEKKGKLRHQLVHEIQVRSMHCHDA